MVCFPRVTLYLGVNRWVICGNYSYERECKMVLSVDLRTGIVKWVTC
jgi:hypothetical protein